MKILKEAKIPSAKDIIGPFFQGIESIKLIVNYIEKYSKSKVNFINGMDNAYNKLDFDNVKITLMLSKPLEDKYNTIIRGISSYLSDVKGSPDDFDLIITL